ncbi:MAG: glycosyltransferase, partial [Bacteroidetes bacterium]|nr:glycosyltransferase [Bacteroidota bacterium]
DESTILIGSVGNFNEVRDQFTLCHLARLLSEQNIDFHLIFAGKRVDNISERYDNCVDYCKEHNLLSHVHFLGSRQDVPNILSQLNAFIYASDHDTFGIAVVEAMAVGVPVFVNDWEVMTEITEDGKLATLYITKDENDLVEKFKLFLQNKEEYKQKALKAASYVRQKYSIEKHIDQLKELCQCLKYVDRSKSKTL